LAAPNRKECDDQRDTQEDPENGGGRSRRARRRGRELRARERGERLGLDLELGHGQRSDETPLAGDTLAKVTAAAKAELPGGTIVRVETDADGNAAYEAHMTKADGTPATVYVDKRFDVVGVESR
jgi:hypothetical protein